MGQKINTINLGGTLVGKDQDPFVIAEMSGNHNQSLDRAIEIVEKAAETGVQALKIQTYTAETMTLDLKEGEFVITDPKSLWHGKSLYELYEQAHTPWDWHKPIFERCRELGLICFSTPFDSTAVDFLEELDCPFYKIASFENTDLQLIKKVANTGKPVIISTGMATEEELTETVNVLRENNCQDFILLKCTSAYPAKHTDANLSTIPYLEKVFQCQVGVSDHTLGLEVPLASVVLGATVIEKHFVLDRNDGGVDSAFSLEPSEFKQLVESSRKARVSIGQVQLGTKGDESKSLQFRRTLYFVKNIVSGETIQPGHIRAIRPGSGLKVKYLDQILGKKATCDISIGTPVALNLVQ